MNRHSAALAFWQQLRHEDKFLQAHGSICTRQRRKGLDDGIDYEEEYEGMRLQQQDEGSQELQAHFAGESLESMEFHGRTWWTPRE
jgi:guanylate kinase